MGMKMEAVPSENADCCPLSSTRRALVKTLSDASKGETTDYYKLVVKWRDLSSEDAESNIFFQIHLRAMSQAVSFISDRDHEALLSYILGMSLWVHSNEVADALTEFAINLATVNGGCLVQCLDMLVHNFLPPSCGLPVFLDVFSRRALMKQMSKEALASNKTQHMERKEFVLQRVHYAIRRIAELVPMTAFHLQPIVLQRMPHRFVDKEWNVLYLESMLLLDRESSGELMQNQMLVAVIDRLIEIDVEIRWEDIVREDDSNRVFVFDMDLDEMVEEGNTGLIGLGSLASVERKETLHAVADKMDVLMDMTFQHLENCSKLPGGVDKVFSSLMSSFLLTIIDTHKSKFTQFLIFYVCSLAPSTCGAKFASLLCDTLFSALHAPNTRMSAAAYLASYLARGSYLPDIVIMSSIERVVNWCVSYTPKQSDKKAMPVDTGLNGVFYSACQAVMYILCFRMGKLMENQEQCTRLRSLCIERLVKHALNPLKICLPFVVEEFLKQATGMHLLYSDVLHEFNKMVVNRAAETTYGENRLDMFFPFDPYLLKQSDRFVRPHFIFWSMVHPQGEELVSDAEDEVDEGCVDSDRVCLDSDAKQGLMCQSLGKDMGSVETVSNGEVAIDEEMDAFELPMNRMSLTPSDADMGFLRAPERVLPLPPRLTPEMILRYSRALV